MQNYFVVTNRYCTHSLQQNNFYRQVWIVTLVTMQPISDDIKAIASANEPHVWPNWTVYHPQPVSTSKARDAKASPEDNKLLHCYLLVWSWDMCKGIWMAAGRSSHEDCWNKVLNPTHYLYVRSSKKLLALTWD